MTLMISTSGNRFMRKLEIGPFTIWACAFLVLAAFGGAIWASAYVYRIYTEGTHFRIEYEALKTEHAQVTADYEQLKDRLAAIEQLESKVRFVFELPPPEQDGLLESTNGKGGGPEPAPAAHISFFTVTRDNDNAEGMDIADGEAPPTALEDHHPASVAGNALARAERLLRSWVEIDEKKVRTREDLVMLPSITPLDPHLPHWISSGFGTRESPFTGRPEFHGGVDITARTGTPVLAPADGIVVELWSGASGGALGNAIKIRHDSREGTYETLYGHLRERDPFAAGLGVGSYVKRNQAIGYVGDTGRTTAPHLHYEVRKNGMRVDPVRYLMDR